MPRVSLYLNDEELQHVDDKESRSGYIRDLIADDMTDAEPQDGGAA